MAELARALRDLRARAGNPSYKTLGQRTMFGHSTMAAAAGGYKCPTLEVCTSFVRACGADPAEVQPLWEAAAHAERAARHAELVGNVSPLPRRRLAAQRAAGPDPWKATTTAAYIHLLRALRAWGGKPGRQAVDVAGRSPGGGPWLSASTFYDALNVKRATLPPLRIVQAMVLACGADVVQWTQAWQALSLAEFNRANPEPAELAGADSGGADATVHPLRQRGNAS